LTRNYAGVNSPSFFDSFIQSNRLAVDPGLKPNQNIAVAETKRSQERETQQKRLRQAAMLEKTLQRNRTVQIRQEALAAAA